jgi:hypothetical protein
LHLRVSMASITSSEFPTAIPMGVSMAVKAAAVLIP